MNPSRSGRASFQSTPPARGATLTIHLASPSLSYFNPRPPRGGRPQRPYTSRFKGLISIHAPREGGDSDPDIDIPCTSTISIHAPREGGDPDDAPAYYHPPVFQSTPPARGATPCPRTRASRGRYFNPRPPRGGRLQREYDRLLRELFQSTPPARGATPSWSRSRRATEISIHAPREGGDSKDAQFYLRIFDK